MAHLALVKDGAVALSAYHPCTASSFGPEPDGTIVEIEGGPPVPGQLYNADTGELTDPPPPE